MVVFVTHRITFATHAQSSVTAARHATPAPSLPGGASHCEIVKYCQSTGRAHSEVLPKYWQSACSSITELVSASILSVSRPALTLGPGWNSKKVDGTRDANSMGVAKTPSYGAHAVQSPAPEDTWDTEDQDQDHMTGPYPGSALTLGCVELSTTMTRSAKRCPLLPDRMSGFAAVQVGVLLWEWQAVRWVGLNEGV